MERSQRGKIYTVRRFPCLLFRTMWFGFVSFSQLLSSPLTEQIVSVSSTGRSVLSPLQKEYPPKRDCDICKSYNNPRVKRNKAREDSWVQGDDTRRMMHKRTEDTPTLDSCRCGTHLLLETNLQNPAWKILRYSHCNKTLRSQWNTPALAIRPL